MRYLRKFLIVFFSICFLSFLAAPALHAYEVYDAEYLELSSEIFADGVWSGGEEVTLDGADYAVHYYYEVGDVRLDYYYSENSEYTAEWMAYEDALTGDAEAFSYVAALDGSYDNAKEMWDWSDTAGTSYEGYGDYYLYDDGSTSGYDYFYYSDLSTATTYDYLYYTEDIWNYADGSYEYYYDSSSRWTDWTWSQEMDLSYSSYSEYVSVWDRPGEQNYGYSYWESLGSGSWMESSWEYDMTSEYDDVADSWSYYYNTEESVYSSYSADYSETMASYYYRDYDTTTEYIWDTEWEYSEYSFEISDSGYYGSSYSYYNYLTDDYEYSSQGFDSWTAEGWDDGVESTWSSYSTGRGGDFWWDYATASEVYSSGESNFWQNGYDYNDNYFYQSTYNDAHDGDYGDNYEEYNYDSEGEFVSSNGYNSSGNSFTGDFDYNDWSTKVTGDVTVDYDTWNYNDVDDAEVGNGYEYSWYDSASDSSYDEEESYQENLDSGSWYQGDYEYWRNGNTGDGYSNESETSYDNAYQETEYKHWNYVYTNWNTTYYQYYNEESLADSDQHYVYYRTYTYDEDDASQLTYERYRYELNSDTGNEYTSYDFDDYSGANNTYYDYDYEQNLFSGAYEEWGSFQISSVSNESWGSGMDLNSYWSYGSEDDYVADTYSDWDYELILASGVQMWDQYYEGAAGWEDVSLTNGGDAWTGEKVVYTDSTGYYDLYLYQAYPDSYFLIEDLDAVPFDS